MSVAPELLARTVPRLARTTRPTRLAAAAHPADTSVRADGSAPLLRRVPLPRTEPAFDDEAGGRAVGAAPVPRYGEAGTGRRHPTPTGPALRLLPGGRTPPPAPVPVTDPDDLVDDLSEVDPDTDEALSTGVDDLTDLTATTGAVVALTARAEARQLVEEAEGRRLDQLPDPRPLAGQLAQAVVEVLSGDRPITQLLTWLNEQIYLELSVLAPDPATSPTVGRARVVTIRPQDRPKIRSVHVCRPADGVAEVAARVQTNGRSRAVAMRLEEWRGRWRCSALVVG